MSPDKYEIGDYLVIQAADGWRVLERFGARRITRPTTEAKALRQARALDARRRREHGAAS